MIRYAQEETFDKILDWLKKKWKIMALVLVVGGPLFAWSQITLLHETSTPDFCNTCHSMHKEYDTWQKSQHALVGLGCGSCHNGGEFLSPRYLLDKVMALRSVIHEMADTAVEGEHPSKAKRDGILLWPQNLRRDRHGRDYYIDIPEDSFAWNVVLRNCERCHLKNSPYEGHEKEALEEHDVEPPQVIELERKDGHSLRVPHSFHRQKGVACMKCHTEVVHGPNPPLNLPRMPLCLEQCHDGKKAHNDCRKCHLGEKLMWAGDDGIDVEKEAGYMEGEADCVDCHGEPEDIGFPRVGNKITPYCVECHDDESYAETKEEWHADWAAKVKMIEPIYAQVTKKIKHTTKTEANKKAFKLYKEGKHNFEFAKRCSGKGVHNIDFAMALFDSALQKLGKAKELL